METSAGEAKLPEHVLDFLSASKILTLATASPTGVPHAATLLYVNDGPNLFVWIGAGSTTSRHAQQNPVVAFTIDEYADDPDQTRGVQGIGECRTVLRGDEIARVAILFGDKFPALTAGESTIGISFCRITPTQLHYIGHGSEADRHVFGMDFRSEPVFNILSDLPTERAVGIGGRLQSLEVGPGDVIVRQGGPADKFFIIVEGEVEVVHEEDGNRQTLGKLGPGDFFGELAILRDASRFATVSATAPTRLMAMDRDTFRDLVAESLGTTHDFDRVVRERLAAMGGEA